jgi:hypothetical protein
MARSRNGSPEPDAPTLAALPCVVLEAVIKRLPLADAARAACACKTLSSAAAAAAAHLTRLESSAAWGVEQPSAEAVGYAARHCSRLELVWLGAGANDEHLFALRRCVHAALGGKALVSREAALLALPSRTRCRISASAQQLCPSASSAPFRRAPL